MPKERDLIKQIKNWLESKGVLVWKFHGSVYGIKGFPDLFGILPGVYGSSQFNGGGRFLAIEVKLPGKKPTVLQMTILKRISKHGGFAFWTDSLEKVKQLLSHLE